jgi:glycosyltransferase involved in cell wall biosynthesis
VPWLAAADVMLHPARLDAFPLVCLHAAFAGTPTIRFV